MQEPGDTPGPAGIARRWAARLAEAEGAKLPAETLESVLLAVAQEAQAEAQAERDAAARRFIDLYAAAPIGVVLGDADGTIRDVNPAFVQLLEYTRSDLIGQPLTSLAATPSDAKALAAALAEITLPGRRPRQERLTVIHAKDGTLRARVTVATVEGGPDGMPHPVLMLEDINELDLLGETLRRQNVQDPLTGLPNAYHFESKLDMMLAGTTGERIALIYLDIDGFRVINDGLGPGAGDEVLRQVARKLEAQFMPHDAVVARLSGDGFAVLLRGEFDNTNVVDLVEDTMRELAEPVYVEGKASVSTSVSASWSPRPPATPVRSCIARPRSRCTGPRRTARPNGCSSNGSCTTGTGDVTASVPRSAVVWRTASSRSTTNRPSSSTAATRSRWSTPCCAGTIPTTVFCVPPTSPRWPTSRA
ncbi:diguanylate cyclase [Saccharomonospora viridis]|uniref:Diguanylate cyclase n=1 Tax=Saccharomonospora viridis TaxID=1852 RepID=A0A837D4R8_9PSEU|nr:diguanylate cyclase [Saccharomonospora viridis]